MTEFHLNSGLPLYKKKKTNNQRCDEIKQPTSMTLQESALGCTINKLGKTSTKSEKKTGAQAYFLKLMLIMINYVLFTGNCNSLTCGARKLQL